MNKKFVLAISLVALICMLAQPVAAYNWNIAFGNTGPRAGSVNFRNPLGSVYAVTSKFNQPRTEGTNPHQGVDLGSPIGTNVYPVYNGWISHRGTYSLSIQLDINDNGVRDDNLYVTYYHLSKNNYYNIGQYVTTSNIVAKSGDENGAYAPHLHFGMRLDTNNDKNPNVWIRNEPYYRGSSTWNYGKDLDLVSLVRFPNGTTAELTAYAMASGYKYAISSGHAVIFHRLPTGSTWSSNTMVKNGDVFTYNLRNNYSAGTSVQWMARIQRSDLSTSVYRWGFQPAKFAQPDSNPNSTAYKYDYHTNTLQ